MRRIGRMARITAVAAGLAVAACGSSGPTRPPRTAAVRPQPARPAGPAFGATQRIRAEGTTLSVKASVTDPLRGSGVALLAGTRAVGVIVRIHNRGPGLYDSSSTGDVSIAPSAGSASAAYASAGRCKTQDRDFDNQIAAGETRAGCVAFTLDAKAPLASVRFAANGGGHGVATWRGR